MTWVVAMGTAWDGIKLLGPFYDHDEAQKWCADNADDSSWDIIALEKVRLEENNRRRRWTQNKDKDT